MPAVHLIVVPYDSGRRGERMGAGPLRLLDAGLTDRLVQHGRAVRVVLIEQRPGVWPGEIRSAFDLAAQVAEAVAAARQGGAFPLVLSGNCGPAALGCVAGIGALHRVLWFDAHGDFNTPDTTVGGFLDGMALATLTGRAWRQLSAAIPRFTPVPESSVTLIGARDLDPLELAALRGSEVQHVTAQDLRPGLISVLHGCIDWPAAYLHFDLDVLDSSIARINEYAAPDGLNVADAEWAISEIKRHTSVAAAALTALDPALDPRSIDVALAVCAALIAETVA